MLKSVGCDSREMFLAARIKLISNKDVENFLKRDGKEEREKEMFTTSYGDPVFHSEGQFENDGLTNSKACVDLGDDSMEKLEKNLMKASRNLWQIVCRIKRKLD